MVKKRVQDREAFLHATIQHFLLASVMGNFPGGAVCSLSCVTK